MKVFSPLMPIVTIFSSWAVLLARVGEAGVPPGVARYSDWGMAPRLIGTLGWDTDAAPVGINISGAGGGWMHPARG